MAGYSKTPLIKKLGLKAGHRYAWLHQPDHYPALLGELPDDVQQLDADAGGLDFVHAFYTERDNFVQEFPALKAAIAKAGMLWISWPKKSSGIKSDLSEDVIRQIALDGGLVDVKVCAVDAVWSGLKLVYRKADR